MKERRDNDDLARILGNESKKTKDDWLNENIMDPRRIRVIIEHVKRKKTQSHVKKKKKNQFAYYRVRLQLQSLLTYLLVVFWIRNRFQVVFDVIDLLIELTAKIRRFREK